jgi:hypothetical protein
VYFIAIITEQLLSALKLAISATGRARTRRLPDDPLDAVDAVVRPLVSSSPLSLLLIILPSHFMSSLIILTPRRLVIRLCVLLPTGDVHAAGVRVVRRHRLPRRRLIRRRANILPVSS